MEEDRKDILIADLKRENFELREAQRKVAVLEAQMLDLEHRFRVLQEEKSRAELELRAREPSLDYLLLKDRQDLADKERAIQDASAELLAYKHLLEDKNADVARLKSQLSSYTRESVLLRSEKRVAESGLTPALESKSDVQAQIDHLSAVNSRLGQIEADTSAKEREKALEAARLRARLRELEELTTLQRQKARQLVAEARAPGLGSRESERLLDANLNLQVEKRALSRKEIELELELRKSKLKLDDALLLVEVKEKDMKSATRADVNKLEQENESLRFLLEKYRNDVETQKRLRNDEIYQKLEIEREKKRVANEALDKELEARRAKRELAQYQESHGQLLDERSQILGELDTLKDHTELLASQNASVLVFFIP